MSTITEVTRSHYREIDGKTVLGALRGARMELGIREQTLIKSSDRPELGVWLEFKIGMGPSTSTVEVRLTSADLFDVTIQRTRKVPGKFEWRRDIVAQLVDVGIEQLRPALVSAWCSACTARNW